MSLLFASGCSITQKVMTKKELTTEFSNASKIAVNVRKLTNTPKDSKNSTKKVRLSNKDKVKIKQYKRSITSSKEKINKTKKISQLSKDVLAYETSVLRYLDKASTTGVTYKETNKSFHSMTKKGSSIVVTYLDGKMPKSFQVAFVSDQLAGYIPDLKSNKGYTIKEAKKSKKNNQKTNKVNTNKNPKPKSADQMFKEAIANMKKEQEKAQRKYKRVVTLEILSGAIAVLIIVVICLQPSKQDESMNALSESGGATLFMRPKPKGYALFLIRTTEVLILLEVIVLILISHVINN